MIRVSFRNKLASITASSQAKDYPVSNIQDDRPSSIWKSAGLFSTSHTLTGIFGETPTVVSCMALLNLVCNTYALITINLKLGATIVKSLSLTGEEILYGYGEGPYGLFAYGGYAAPGREWLAKFRVRWFEEVLCDNWEVIINQTDNTACSLGTLFFGEHWEAPTYINQDYSTGFTQSIGDIQRSIGGVTVGTVSIVGRKVSCELHMLTEDDVKIWNDNAKCDKPILFSIRPELNDTEALFGTIMGYLQNDISFTGSKAKRFRGKISIDEVK